MITPFIYIYFSMIENVFVSTKMDLDTDPVLPDVDIATVIFM